MQVGCAAGVAGQRAVILVGAASGPAAALDAAVILVGARQGTKAVRGGVAPQQRFPHTVPLPSRGGAPPLADQLSRGRAPPSGGGGGASR